LVGQNIYRTFTSNKFIKQTNKQMKKVIAIFAIATTLVACGGQGTSTEGTDSTAVSTDSTAVLTDSTAVQADTTATATEAVK
jgi:ABC-type glycerol-3-phosphate transport system substrate-binding protein